MIDNPCIIITDSISNTAATGIANSRDPLQCAGE